MYFYRERALYRKAFAISIGVRTLAHAITGNPMEPLWYLAQSETEEQALYMMQKDGGGNNG